MGFAMNPRTPPTPRRGIDRGAQTARNKTRPRHAAVAKSDSFSG
jgi:hypothetical protein